MKTSAQNTRYKRKTKMGHKTTVIKNDIARAIWKKTGYSQQFSKELVNEFFDIIKSHLLNGQGVQIHGFGKFIIKNKKSRKGRNPQTGRQLIIPARKAIVFYPSDVLNKKC